jgi:hypothetical protein
VNGSQSGSGSRCKTRRESWSKSSTGRMYVSTHFMNYFYKSAQVEEIRSVCACSCVCVSLFVCVCVYVCVCLDVK